MEELFSIQSISIFNDEAQHKANIKKNRYKLKPTTITIAVAAAGCSWNTTKKKLIEMLTVSYICSKHYTWVCVCVWKRARAKLFWNWKRICVTETKSSVLHTHKPSVNVLHVWIHYKPNRREQKLCLTGSYVLNFMLRDCHVAFFLCKTHTEIFLLFDYNLHYVSVSMLYTISILMLMSALIFFFQTEKKH